MYMANRQTPVRHAQDHGADRLTSQRRQIKNLIAAGHTYATIAKIIGKSVARVGAIADEIRGKSKPVKAKKPRKTASDVATRIPWNRIPLEVETEIRQMVRDGIARAKIIEQSGQTRSVVDRIIAQMKPNGTAIQRTKPMICTRREDCLCTLCNANRLKTREVMLQLHAADEAARLGRA